jgi:acyl-CoA synthetase (AMP-forming)/AMP-acid ligase II
MDQPGHKRDVSAAGSDVALALSRHPRIRGCTLVAHRDSHGGPVLLAYLSMCPLDRISAADLRAYLRSACPETQVPVMFVRLDRLPRLCTVRRAA